MNSRAVEEESIGQNPIFSLHASSVRARGQLRACDRLLPDRPTLALAIPPSFASSWEGSSVLRALAAPLQERFRNS